MCKLYVCKTLTVDTDKEIILEAFKMCCYQKMFKDSIDKYNKKPKLWYSISKSEMKTL